MIWTRKLILLKHLSVTNVACVLLIGELIKPYFTVQPATFNGLFELKFCPSIWDQRCNKYLSTYFPSLYCKLQNLLFSTWSVSHSMDLQLG